MCRVLNEDGWKIMDDGDFLFCLQISFSVSPTPTLRPLGYLNTHTYTYIYMHVFIYRLIKNYCPLLYIFITSTS